jgi:hypothetical protein
MFTSRKGPFSPFFSGSIGFFSVRFWRNLTKSEQYEKSGLF